MQEGGRTLIKAIGLARDARGRDKARLRRAVSRAVSSRLALHTPVLSTHALSMGGCVAYLEGVDSKYRQSFVLYEIALLLKTSMYLRSDY
jgi:hypothetical protein